MRIFIATPAPAGSNLGNRVTALRWARLLRGLGHRVRVGTRWERGECDLLVALHLVRSAASVALFRRAHPTGRVIAVLTGTDFRGAAELGPVARRTARLADRLIVLQGESCKAFPAELRRKARVILQSAEPCRSVRPIDRNEFEVVAGAHLREVKDPLLAAAAVRRLPATSRVHVTHFGAGLDPGFARRARAESGANPRWTWVGERPRGRWLAALGKARAFVMTSRAEGGSSALAEAIVSGVPILCTRIPAAVGMLGRRHPGFFAPGDAAGLARLLVRLESESRFRRQLARASRRQAPRFSPRRELRAWQDLLDEFSELRPRRGRRPRSS
jgi:putative glycosyltransferase (TIGR04348 family)